MKILNLYAGIGGNRMLWENAEVTAVEIDPDIAEVYHQLYPNDTVIIGDAHNYLEKYFAEFDFIWSSPPCPSHGQYRHNIGVLAKGYSPLIPDMRLYGEIIFLQTYCKSKWAVENTVPYYTPLVAPTFKLQRHLFWSNFSVPEKNFESDKIRSKNRISDFSAGAVISKSNIKNKRQVLRNMCDPKIGKYIFDCQMHQALNIFHEKYPVPESYPVFL